MSEPTKDIILATPFSTIKARCHYPEENTEEVMDEIVRALRYVGVFEVAKIDSLPNLEKYKTTG